MNPTTRPRLRFLAWAALVVGLLGGQLTWLVLLRGPRILDNDRFLISGQIALVALLALVAWLLLTTPANAILLSKSSSHRLILGGTILLQSFAIVLLWPALSEDLVRYRLEGRMWLSGVSPYATSPAEWIEAGRPTDSIDEMVTYPQVETIYPPISQLAFATARGIESLVADPPPDVQTSGRRGISRWRAAQASLGIVHRGLVLRAISALAAIVATALLLLILRDMGRSPWWAVLFAWNPLVSIECGGMGHVDVLGAMILLAIVLLVHRQRWSTSGAALALATCVKPLAILLLPFVWRPSVAHDGVLRPFRAPLAFAIVLIALLGPALLWQRGYAGFLNTIQMYSGSWEANGSIYRLIKVTADETDGHDIERKKAVARTVPFAAAIITGLLLWRRRARLETAGYWLLLVLLLTAPVAYPWYLIWMLAFVPLLHGRAGWTGLVWSGTVAINYVVWHQPVWLVPSRLAMIEYAPVYLVLLIELWSLIRTSRDERDETTVRNADETAMMANLYTDTPR